MFGYTETKDTLTITSNSIEVGAGSFVQLRIRTKKHTFTKLVCNGTDYFVRDGDISPRLDGSVTLFKDPLENEVFVERFIYTLNTSLDKDEALAITKINPLTGGIEVNGKASAVFANSAFGLPKVLVFGCSIAQQCNVYHHSTTSTTSGFTPAKSKTLQVANGALFAAGDRISLPLYNARMYVATVESVAANVLTLTAPLPAGVRDAQAIWKLTATQTMGNMLQGIGAGNSGVILLGSPAEVLDRKSTRLNSSHRL